MKIQLKLSHSISIGWLSILLMLVLIVPTGYAQEQKTGKMTVSGIVKDENGEPLVSATVILKGSKKGTVTDENGEYTIQASTGDELTFRYLGYQPYEVKIGKKEKYNVTLLPTKDVDLQEVVVIGYGAAKKKDLTGSVATVKMADIKNVPVVSVDQALQGRIAGADIMSTTGEPGATTSIRIRGTRSISATNEPLIIVDGVIDGVHDLSDINSSDIESITVLKDASSTAIYGSRGSNGVIIVTTKQGLMGKPTITFKGDAGFSQLPRELDIMNATEFAQYRNDYAFFATSDDYGSVGPTTPQSKYPYPNPWKYGEGTNWVREITQTAPYQNYSLSVSGGVKGVSYYASLSYNDTRGIIQNSGFKRYTGRLNLDYQIFKWLKIGYKYNYTNRDQDVNLADIGGTTWYRAAIYLNPLLSATSDFNDLWYSGQKYNSPRVYIDMCKNNAVRTSSNNTLYLEFEPIKNLKIRTQESLYTYNRNSYQYQPGTLPAKAQDEGGYAYRAEYNEQSLLSENTVSYRNEWKSGHNLDVMGGFTAQSWKTNNLTLSGRGYFLDENTWNNMGAIPDKNNYSASSSRTEKMKMSLLARLNYNYKQRYYITLTGRRDGASNFAANHKWGFFPSGALKWNITNEPFIDNEGWLNELALRLSAGRTGNDGIGAYRSLAALSSSTGGYLFGGNQPVAYYPSRLASDNLTWEKTDLYNLALDLSLFKNRINVTLEGYLSYTKDLLLNVQTPTQTGYSSKFANVGKTNNKGVEVSIETQNIVLPDFGWSTTLTLSHNRQKVTDIGTSDFVAAYSAYGNNSYMMYGYVKDYPLNALWGFKYGGTWKNQEEIKRNEITKAYVSTSGYQKSPGCARFMDVNHDGIMNEEDLVYMGSADPWLYGGLQNTFRYKNLSLSVYFNYSLGGKIYNISEQWMGGSYMTNQYRYMLDGWHPVRNPNSDIPRAGSGECIASDRMIYDASFLRLKNISISYNFDLRRQTRNIIRDLTLSASGENLYLWKKYNGFDPDVSSESESSTLRRVDIGAYPKARTIIFSVQVRY